MNDTIRIMFVCHGNICRSPMAEMIMKDLVRKNGSTERFVIASCATSSEELGNPVYPPARRTLEAHGIICETRHAVRMTSDDYVNYDHIIAMDRRNLGNMKDRVGNDPENKVKLLMSYVGKDTDVADPWYTGDFEKTFRDISDACKALLHQLTGCR